MSEIRSISIVSKSALTVSQKSGKTYFTIEDDQGNRYITFNPKLHNELEVGSIVPLVITPSTREGSSPSFDKPKDGTESKPDEPTHEVSGQEIGMWYNNLGNRIGDGSLERDFPKTHVKIKGQYYKRMSEVLGINFKE
jgi:hypothetical protein